jgi:uncharacterized protein
VKLRNEFEVAVPLERVWETLIDIERVARFLPGATIEPGSDQGVHQGSMRVKVGPMVVDYRGTARLGKVDAGERTADIEVQAKEARGQGTAAAVISSRLEQLDGHTRVVAETDLQITGRQARFGRGIMQDVAGRMLDQFAARFEAYLLEGEPEAPDAAGSAAAPSPDAGGDDALDLGSLLRGSAAARYGTAAALALAAALVVRALVRGRRPRGLRIELR